MAVPYYQSSLVQTLNIDNSETIDEKEKLNYRDLF